MRPARLWRRAGWGWKGRPFRDRDAVCRSAGRRLVSARGQRDAGPEQAARARKEARPSDCASKGGPLGGENPRTTFVCRHLAVLGLVDCRDHARPESRRAITGAPVAAYLALASPASRQLLDAATQPLPFGARLARSIRAGRVLAPLSNRQLSVSAVPPYWPSSMPLCGAVQLRGRLAISCKPVKGILRDGIIAGARWSRARPRFASPRTSRARKVPGDGQIVRL